MTGRVAAFKELTPERERGVVREALAQARLAMQRETLNRAAVLMRADGLLKVVYGELLDCLDPRHSAYLLTVSQETDEECLLAEWRDARKPAQVRS